MSSVEGCGQARGGGGKVGRTGRKGGSKLQEGGRKVLRGGGGGRSACHTKNGLFFKCLQMTK